MSKSRELYKMTEYESPTGWYIGNYSHVGQGSNAWYLPARVLGMDICDYVNMLLNEYHVIPVSWMEYPDRPTWRGLFLFKWPDYKTAHSFLLRVNKAARDKQFYLEWDK